MAGPSSPGQGRPRDGSHLMATVVGRLMQLSGERRVGVAGRPGFIYGETTGLGARTVRFLLWVAATGSLIGLVAWLLFSGHRCVGLGVDSQFAGTSGRFLDGWQRSPDCDLPAMRSFLFRDYLFAAVSTTGLGLFLTVWWNASWDAEPGFSRLPGAAFGAVAGGALIAESVENTVTLLGLHRPLSQAAPVGLSYAPIVFTIAWIKWALVAVLVAAAMAVVVAWLIRAAAVLWRSLRGAGGVEQAPPIHRWRPDAEAPALGIGLSGGGIRSAAFGLGALSALEETEVRRPRPGRPPGVLGQADLLASVSGGGYAAAAWRTAVGIGSEAIVDRPIIGDPNRHPPRHGRMVVPPEPSVALDHPAAEMPEDGLASDADLFPRLRDRRDYLRNGRGGLQTTAVVVLLQMVWHLAVIATLVAILAWPLGRFIGSWIISVPNPEMAAGRIVDARRLAVPVVALAAVLVVVLALRSFTFRGRRRRTLDRVALAVLGLGLLLASSLLVLPWVVLEVGAVLDDSLRLRDADGSGLAALIGAGVVGSVASGVLLDRAPLAGRAPYLGGLLLAGGLTWLGLTVAYDATVGEGTFAVGWMSWSVAVLLYLVVVTTTNPDLWSLHWIYRRRLAQTFANRWDPARRQWVAVDPGQLPPLSAYRDAPGPRQVICAVAARGERTTTGIPVVSMTFEPDRVTVHCGPDPDDPTGSLSHAVATEQYEALFHGRVAADRYRNVFCATALSAAAVAPSLGRHDLGSTNALIAALNLRLGVWMPNPKFRRGRRAAPDLFAMFKELSGWFDLDEPNLYVTDGGHWENLALVELVRRRTSAIITVDASGDRGYGFSALEEAVELAQLECATRIRFVDDGLDGMRPGRRSLAARNWCRAEIDYPDGRTGRLLYVKAQASEQMPLDVLRYSKEDPTFPNYSTADQLLGESEFCNLAILGRESMIAALDDHHQWLFDESDETTDEGDADIADGGVEDAAVADGPEVVRTPTRRAGAAVRF